MDALSSDISIHALLAESDMPVDGAFLHQADFYPRSPCGERPTTTIITCIVLRFLSTLSLRRATLASHSKDIDQPISIHALLAESD